MEVRPLPRTVRYQLGMIMNPNIKANLSELEKLLKDINSEYEDEDGIYRFYHQSFKVYHLQGATEAIVKLFKSIMPNCPLNEWFVQIVADGTGKQFDMSHNAEWLKHTRSIVEAFLHAKYFLEMMIRFGSELNAMPDMLPFGWAGVMYLYNLR